MNLNTQEFMKMAEQAAAMSQMFNNSPDNDIEEPLNKMRQAAEMANLLTTLSKCSSHAWRETQNGHLGGPQIQAAGTEAGGLPGHIPELEAAKAALPHFDLKYRQNLMAFIKMIELQNLLYSYGKKINNLQKSGRSDWQKAMLQAISEQMPGDKKHQVDTFIKFIEFQEVLKQFNRH